MEIPPEVMDGWEAMNRIVPLGDEKICWVLAAGFAALMNQIAWASGAKDFKPVKPRDFIPWLKKTKKPKPKYVSPNAAAAAFLMAVNR